MSRYLYLVRHGEQQDAEHGLPDGPLSPRGVRQARALAERLGGVPFTGAWTSRRDRFRCGTLLRDSAFHSSSRRFGAWASLLI